MQLRVHQHDARRAPARALAHRLRRDVQTEPLDQLHRSGGTGRGLRHIRRWCRPQRCIEAQRRSSCQEEGAKRQAFREPKPDRHDGVS